MKVILLFCCLILSFIASAQSDEEAIKNVLVRESATWRSGDVVGHAACWAIKPYSKIIISTAAGKVYDVPPMNIVNPAPGSMGNGGSSSNRDYTFGITGNSAWVTHKEESITKDGKISHSTEIRMLEKIDGQWKLVGQSIHMVD